MAPSSGIKMLKEESPAFAKRVAEWKKDWVKPLTKSEIEKLKQISNKIDDLLTEYYKFQLTIAIQTNTRQNIFGATRNSEQAEMKMRSYDEKERLADQRNRHSAPYFKLKMVMDYWCSLWFWDVRDADQLPNRNQYWNDIASILQLETNATVDGIIEKRGQQKLFEPKTQLSMAWATTTEEQITTNAAEDFMDAVVEYTNRKDLFDNNQRLSLVSQLAKKYFFFHPQLEFLEVFWERGGFDLIAGNPPWVNIELDLSGLLSVRKPEIIVNDLSAAEVKIIAFEFSKSNNEFLIEYIVETIDVESTKAFITSNNNYNILNGQKNNVYKCILVNSLNLINKSGISGLIHPIGLFDDPEASKLRQKVYKSLIYHFQFVNVLKLFSEILHWVTYGINIYTKEKEVVDFDMISYLYHPNTIDGSYIDSNSNKELSGLKIKKGESYVWNILPDKKRIINIDKNTLENLTNIVGGHDAETPKLLSIFAKPVLNVLIKIGLHDFHLRNTIHRTMIGFDEASFTKSGKIIKKTQIPILSKYESIISGPHFYVSQPIFKNPRIRCIKPLDYDVVNLTEIKSDFLQRVNFLPGEDIELFKCIYERKDELNWIDSYKAIFSRMLSQSGERTLQCAILPPKFSHINSINSIVFKNLLDLVDLVGSCSSIVIDFYLKVLGSDNLKDDMMESFQIIHSSKLIDKIRLRTLLLNCLTENYSDIWKKTFNSTYIQDSWSIRDKRLRVLSDLSENWNMNFPLRSYFERRQAMIEIDVLVAMGFGLTLEELALIYNVQFPVLQQNEDDTWYDTKGNIVFTCSKGLVGVGLDRKEWEQIRNLPAGETYEHTITKSELYNGKVVTYHAPFDKCDRVEDYKVAWAYFEEVFKEK